MMEFSTNNILRSATLLAPAKWAGDAISGTVFGFNYRTESVGDSDRDIITLRIRHYEAGSLIELVSEPHFAADRFRWLERTYDTRGRRVSEKWVVERGGTASVDENIVTLSYPGWNIAQIDDGKTNLAVEERDWRG
jgi:hypothetical protein